MKGVGQFFLFSVRAERCDFGPLSHLPWCCCGFGAGRIAEPNPLSVGTLKIFPFKCQISTAHGIFSGGEGLIHHQAAGASSGWILPARGSLWQRLWSVMVCWGGFEIAGFLVLSGPMLSGWVPPPRSPHPAAFWVGIHLPNPGRRF